MLFEEAGRQAGSGVCAKVLTDPSNTAKQPKFTTAVHEAS